MGPAIFVIAILGCGEADAPCQQVSVAPAHYSSFAACNDATEAAVAQATDVDFPVVVAQCKAEGMPASLQVRASDIKMPEPVQTGPRVLPASYRPVRPPHG